MIELLAPVTKMSGRMSGILSHAVVLAQIFQM